jgi:hypothetical protein
LTSYNNHNVLLNSIIEDLGQGQKSYNYEFSQSANDYLDIFDKGSKDSDQPYFDSGTNGISDTNTGDASFTYKFDTIWPFSNIKFSYNAGSVNYLDTLGFYSFDGVNWLPVSQISSEDGGLFGETLTTDKNISQLFLKISPDKTDLNNNTNIFGIKNLQVSATLGN